MAETTTDTTTPPANTTPTDAVLNVVPPVKPSPTKVPKAKKSSTTTTGTTATPAVARRHRFFNGTMVLVSLLCVAGIITGATVGIWFKKTFLANYDKTDYSNLQEAELRDDAADIALRQGYGTKTPTKNKDALIKAFVAAEYNGLHANNFSTFANSFVDMGITTQSSYSDKTYDGTTVITNTASAGMISFAERVTYRVGDADLTLIRDKNLIKTSGDQIDCPFGCRFHQHANAIITSNYTAALSTQSHADYVAATGNSPYGLITHIVSSKTVVNDPASTFRTLPLADGATGYAFSLQLNPKTAVLNTAKQMKYLSGLNDYPTFQSVRLDVVLVQKNGKIFLKTIDSTEKYVVPYGMLAPQGTGYTHTEFTFDNVVTDGN